MAAKRRGRVKHPIVIVCAGGGGVGKTTTSAALALALAKSGYRALIVSIDPARRLADAMGVELGTEARELSLDSGSGQLFGLMPDPQDALRTFVEFLFAEEPEALERLLDNRLYRVLEAAVPGIHEVATISLTWRAIIENEVDAVVIDTAPSRNAVDFITYPKRLAKLLGGRAVGWMAAIGKRTGVAPQEDKMGRVEQLLVRALGPVARDVAGLFAEMARVRDGIHLVSPVLKKGAIPALWRGFEAIGVLQELVIELVDVLDVGGLGFLDREVEGDSSEIGQRADWRQGLV